MTQDEIIRMAREAGDEDKVDPIINDGQWITFTLEELERFAALVAESERNTCIADCMEQHKASIEASEKAKKVRDQETYFNTATGAKFAAIRIQQRGNVK